MGYLERASELADELIYNRRAIHRFAETGFDLPNTVAFVKSKLTEYGYSPVDVGKSGITCIAGKPGKTILLRGDMDALPMREESGLDFAATNGNCHSCGHDIHTAMLLCAAKMLKEREAELNGAVKFMFQPAEETMGGCKDMIAAGVMENPTVNAAIAIHVLSGLPNSKSGHILYRGGTMMNSGDSITIHITGKSAHGSMSYKGVDAINIASHVAISLQEIVAREVPADKEAIVVVGTISGGSTNNTVPGEAVLGVSVRAESVELRDFLVKRVFEIAESTAAVFRGSASVKIDYSAPVLVNDSCFTEEIAGYAKALLPAGIAEESPKISGSEDFTYITQLVPASWVILGCGSMDEGYTASLHNPKIVFDEQGFHVGAATIAHCAEDWLRNNSIIEGGMP